MTLATVRSMFLLAQRSNAKPLSAAENKPHIVKWLESAFHMAETAAASLDQRPWNAQHDPVFADISRIANWIFKDPGNTAPLPRASLARNPLDFVSGNY